MWLPSDTLQHSRGPWKKHKYTAIKNGRYIYPGESVEGAARNYRQAAKTAAREQEKGKNRTAQNYRARGAFINTNRATWEANEKARIATGPTAKKYKKQAAINRHVYEKGISSGATEENSKSSARRITDSNGLLAKPYSKNLKNKTYRKNQRRAKLESLIFKGKRKVKKLLKNLIPRSQTKVTVSSNLMPAGTKKDITKQYNNMKKKKKRR